MKSAKIAFSMNSSSNFAEIRDFKKYKNSLLIWVKKKLIKILV
jgi:hypothetical protein